MTDIIKGVKKLLDGATPGKWRAADSDIIAKDSNRFIATVSEYSGLDDPSEEYANVQLIAGAPELAQALAEEEYQYGVTYTGLKHGGQHIQWVESTGDTEWDKETLQWLIKRWKKQGQSPKIVRRRVSTVEVVNDNRFTR